MAVAVERRRLIQRPPRRWALGSSLAHAYVGLIGITTWFSVHLIGELPIGEILMVCALPVALLFSGRKALRPELKTVYALLLLWLLGQVIADIYNHTAMADRMRGSAAIVFFAIDLLGMSMLVGHSDRRKLIYLVGLMIGTLAQTRFMPSPDALDYLWKFGYATGAMLLALLVSSYFFARRRFMLSALPVLFICGVNLLMNFRSPVLDLMVTLVLLYPVIPERLGSVRLLPRQGSGARLLVLATFVMVAGLAAQSLIQFVTHSGYISEENQQKNVGQSGASNLLLGGRPEFIVGLRAALDAPIIGHGSWPQERKYVEMFADLLAEQGRAGGSTNLILTGESGLIPTHSHIVGSWVFAGISGLVFWIYIMWVLLRSIVQISVLRPPLAPIYTWMMITMFWDLWFSPFASFRRLEEAFLLIVIADLPRIKSRVAVRGWVRQGASRGRSGVRRIPSFSAHSRAVR
jgi:hypothetical protein